ncbi:MAG: hypothetical protein HYY06_07960 [Deltaproteobacteria bacterium]|nr:hypothetical protein [Deltaproteobacteria bacterium]
MPASSALTTRARLPLFLPLALLYLGVFPYFEGINNPNEMVRVYMTVSLAEEGSFAIDAIERRWGTVNDKARHAGHVYSSKAPGTSYLGVPVYLLHRAVARALGHVPDKREIVLVLRLGAVAMPCLVFLWFFSGWLLERARSHPHLGRAVFVSIAAGSLLYAYGITFVSHALNAACVFGAMIALGAVRERGPRAHLVAALAGLLCAAATMFEYPAAIATAVVGAHGVVELASRPGSRLRALSFLAGGMPPALATMAFHAAAFGDPLSSGYAHLDNPSFRSNIGEGFFGATIPSPMALLRLLGDPSIGLFVGTPILLFALAGLPRALGRRRAETIVAASVFLLMLVFVSALNNWRGGWTIGPRYLATCVPFLAYPALCGLEALADRSPTAASVAAGTATFLALALTGVASAVYPHVPESFTVPFAQLFVPLLESGHAPYSFGWLVGLAGVASLVPAAVALVFSGCLAARPRDLGFALGLAAAALAALIWLAPRTDQERRALAHVEKHWEPRATVAPAPSSLGAKAHDAALRGDAKRAIVLYGRAAGRSR